MIETVSLFPKLNESLISLLRSLTADEWQQQTIAKKWKVKDIAAHLLDGNCRMISIYRDNHLLQPDRLIESYEGLVSYLNDINQEWIQAAKRLSPQLLTDMLETTGREYDQIIAELNPNDDAIFSVAWAGESVSKNWFHIAREYTEKWHHQQQIRDAVNRPGIMTKEFFHPLIATFLQGLPHTFRDVDARPGSAITIKVENDGGTWQIIKSDKGWELSSIVNLPEIASVILPGDIAWKLFTKGISLEKAVNHVTIEGNFQSGKKVLELVAVMA